MNYVVSDIHGCREKYETLLHAIHFGRRDTLYFLGDALDRGPEGFRVLLDMASRKNVLSIRGNHEAMASHALLSLLHCLMQENGELDQEAQDAMELWFYNGGEQSLADFMELSSEEQLTVLRYMTSMPLYREAEVSGRKYVLVHGGLENFLPERPLDSYQEDEVVWARPEPDTRYYRDRTVILGHTPVCFLDGSPNRISSGSRIFHTESYMDIDCGCVFGGPLACICLETQQEVYV